MASQDERELRKQQIRPRFLDLAEFDDDDMAAHPSSRRAALDSFSNWPPAATVVRRKPPPSAPRANRRPKARNQPRRIHFERPPSRMRRTTSAKGLRHRSRADRHKRLQLQSSCGLSLIPSQCVLRLNPPRRRPKKRPRGPRQKSLWTLLDPSSAPSKSDRWVRDGQRQVPRPNRNQRYPVSSFEREWTRSYRSTRNRESVNHTPPSSPKIKRRAPASR